jgi:hypothetical protein
MDMLGHLVGKDTYVDYAGDVTDARNRDRFNNEKTYNRINLLNLNESEMIASYAGRLDSKGKYYNDYYFNLDEFDDGEDIKDSPKTTYNEQLAHYRLGFPLLN